MPRRRESTVQAPERPRPRIICVLGMHRSGTSAATRMLNLLGVYLGPESRLMPPKADNPTGYWEYDPFTRINDEILARFDGSWQNPPLLAAGWERSTDLHDLRRRARTLMRRDFAGHGLWGWKDPRTCLTLPFWQGLQSSMRYVVCLRNPWDAAQSLERRYGSFDKGIGLWLAYTHSVLAHTQGQSRMFVYYEDLINDWPRELRRLAHFVGRPQRATNPEVRKAVEGFIDANLHHHRTSTIQLVEEAGVSFPAKAVYVALRSHLTEHEQDRTAARSEELEISLRLLCKEALAAHRKLEETERALPAMDQRIDTLQGLVATLEGTLGEKERQVQAAVQDRLVSLASMEESFAETRLGAEMERAQRERADEQRIRDLEESLSERQGLIRSLQGDVATLEGTVTERERQMQAVDALAQERLASLGRLEEALIDARRGIEALEQGRAQHERAVDQRVRDVEESLRLREAVLQQVDQEREGLLREAQLLHERERELRRLLGLIQESRGWRALERFRRARRRIENLLARLWGPGGRAA